jgi:hypothetical protein
MEHQHSQKWWAKLGAPSWELIHFPFAARIKGLRGTTVVI